MRILVSDSLEQILIDVLTRDGFEVDNKPGLPLNELKNVIGKYDGLIVRSSTKVTAELIDLASRMKVIGRAGTGVDNIDVEAATRRGILVMNTPGGNTISAAEHTVSMLLSLARNIPQAHMSMAKGEWERKRFIGTEVFEKTLGVIGLGKIGREVAQRCQCLGMKTIGYDPVLSNEVAMKLNIELVTLDELYRRSDFITVHTPLTSETKGLLNDVTLAKCKRGVRIISGVRGLGRSMVTLAMMRPGRALITATVSARNTASAIEWVTSRVVVARSDRKARPRILGPCDPRQSEEAGAPRGGAGLSVRAWGAIRSDQPPLHQL